MNLNIKQLKTLIENIAITATDIEIEKIDSNLKVRVEYGLEVVEIFEIDKEGNRLNSSW
jgi:hypothetical protein